MMLRGKGMATLSIVAVAAACVAQRPEPNAFVNKPAHSITQLIAQIESDPEVRDRFERHFYMNEDQLVAYLRTLHLVKLEQDGHYAVFNADEDDGNIRARILHLKKGTYIWADPEGNLVLKKGCANPLSTGPMMTAHQQGRLFTPAELPVSLTRREPEPGDTEPLELIPMAEILEPAFVYEPGEIVPTTDTMPPKPVDEEQIPPLVTGGGGFPWALLGVPFIFGLTGGGDGGTTTTGGGTATTGGTTGGGEIPGPAAALVFGLPAIHRMLARRKKDATPDAAR